MKKEKSILPECYEKNDALNLAGFYPAASCLGPGVRAIIWVQGCLLNCPECINPAMQPLVNKAWVEVRTFADFLCGLQGVEGISLVGGEPMLQAKAVGGLLKLTKKHSDLSVMLYTGYTLDFLKKAGRDDYEEVLALTDILVDGPYLVDLDRSQKWRGSENQKIHFLTERYKEWQWVEEETKRDVEIHVDEKGSYLVLGIPPKGMYEKLPGLVL